VNEPRRLGAAAREAAARELGEHYAMGRITTEEHSERLEQVWAARTSAELQPVFRDLPRPQPARPARQPRPAAASQSGTPDRWPPMPRVPFLFKLLVAILVLAVALHHLWFLLIALLVYVFVIRRFTHRRRWAAYHGRTHTGWH
jgi:Flp pilus assembly protein TadB